MLSRAYLQDGRLQQQGVCVGEGMMLPLMLPSSDLAVLLRNTNFTKEKVAVEDEAVGIEQSIEKSTHLG